MNDNLQADPITEAVRFGEEVSAKIPSFMEVLGQAIPRKLEDVQGTVGSIVTNLKDIELSRTGHPSDGFNHPKTEAKFNEVLEQILDILPQLLHVVKEYVQPDVFNGEQWETVWLNEACQDC